MERRTYEDGRWVPLPGETVYQKVSGPFGMPASLLGVVNPSGKSVKVTGGAALMGALPVGKSVKLTPAWTAYDDPTVEAKRAEGERAKADEKAADERAKAEAEGAVRAYVARLGLRPVLGPRDVEVGGEVVVVSPNRYGNPNEPVVETLVVASAGGRWIESDEGRTYAYGFGLYRAG